MNMPADLSSFVILPAPHESGGLAPARPSGRGSSYWFSFMVCPQFHCYRHWLKVLGGGDGLQVRWGSPAQNFGSCVHQGQAQAWLKIQSYQQGRDPKDWMEPEEAIRYAMAEGALGPLDQSEWDRLGFVLDHSLPQGLDGHPWVLAVEQVASWQFGMLNLPGHPEHGQPLVYEPRQDLVLADAAGRVYVVDHKTTGASKPGTTSKSYSMSGQFLAARAAGRERFGAHYGGVMLNLIPTRPPWGGAMKVLDAAPAAERRVQQRMVEAAHYKAELERATILGQLDPWAWPAVMDEKVCIHKYGECEALELCRWGRK